MNARTIEDELTKHIRGRVLSQEEFEAYRNSSGFTDGFRGTYRTGRGDVYLYVKGCHEAETEEQARRNLRVAQHLTSLGALFPKTRWGIFRYDGGQYQMFAVTRALEAYKGQPHIEGRERLTKFQLDEKSRYRDIFEEGSHILSWYRRVDPNFDPKSETGKQYLTFLLNPFEAWHEDNWGWSEDGRLYPIDVEVIGMKTTHDISVVNSWCKDNPVKKMKRI